MTEAVRLAKRLAALLPCSRSEAEQYIEGGWVRVDGRVVEEPQFRVTDEKIELDPHATLQPPAPVTLLLHVPAGQATPQQLLTAATHWPDDPSPVRLLKRHFSQLTEVLALEPAASGLLVYSQDARVLRKLTQDAQLLEIEVMVEVQGEVAPAALQALQRSPSGDTAHGPHVKASLNSSRDGRSRLRFAVKGWRAGLIAQLCDRAGLRILAMQRIRIGRVGLAQLPPGQWRYLLSHERF
jgi:23S rRNA pseudouridine2604 synthase